MERFHPISRDLEKQTKQVLKANLKSQVKLIKAKLVKNGALKQGLSMGLSEEQQSFEAYSKAQSEKRHIRRQGNGN